MKKRGTLPGFTLFSIILMIITIVLALFTSLISTSIKLPGSFLTVIYDILIFAVVISLGFSIIQFYITWTSNRTIQTDTEKIEIELSPEILLKEQIKNEVKSVVEEVEQIQEAIDNQTELEISKDVSSDIDDILRMLSINPRAALLLLSTKLEDRLKIQLQEANLQSDTNYVSPRLAIDLAENAELLSGEAASTFRNFLLVRNKVAHDAAFDVDEATILTLVSIGIELLKIVSAKKRKHGELPVSNVDMES
jgi:hypothetical protein